MTLIKLGELIEQVNRKNSALQYGIDDVRGVMNTKGMMQTRANVTDRSFDKFYIIEPGEFVFNRRTTRNGERLGLAFNDTNRAYIFTEDYVAFTIKDKEKLLPEYLYIFFQRDEFDRLVRYSSWGSATEFFNWEDMCDIVIDLPPISIQQKYVDVYNSMLANQRAYESGLEYLNTAIAACIEEFKHTAPRVALGTLLEEIDVRNRDGAISNVQGININKEFMPSVANLSETDLTKYKIVEKNQFAANFMHVLRDERVPFALYHYDEPCIVSPAYPVFRVKSDDALAEYIMLWINRPESDRYAWFISDSSVRGGLEMSRFYEIEIPLPSVPQQQAVVNFYNARHLIQRNITTLGGLRKDLCPVLIKGAIEEAKTARKEG
ncbi:restriction endonuclease subunit S [Brevibacillus gelatini]